MKTLQLQLLGLLILLFSGCSSSSIKNNINKTGDAAGQAIGELATGISNGVKKSIEPKIEINDRLKRMGISFGKMTINNDSVGNNNVLIVYVIFEKDFNGILIAKAFDSKDLEMGRIKQDIKGKKDDTKFIEFHFDKRTELKNDSKIKLE